MNIFDSSLNEHIRKKYPKTEVVADVQGKAVIKNADYFLNNREIIAELKCFETEKYLDIHNMLQDLSNKREIPPF